MANNAASPANITTNRFNIPFEPRAYSVNANAWRGNNMLVLRDANTTTGLTPDISFRNKK